MRQKMVNQPDDWEELPIMWVQLPVRRGPHAAGFVWWVRDGQIAGGSDYSMAELKRNKWPRDARKLWRMFKQRGAKCVRIKTDGSGSGAQAQRRLMCRSNWLGSRI